MTTPIGSIPASSIPTVRAWLLAQLQATLKPDPTNPASELLICDGEPGTYEPDDVVWLGDVHQDYEPEQTTGSGGPGWLREDYQQHIHVEIYRGGDDPTGCFGRARALADLVVAIVRSDPSLGGAVTRARPASATHSSRWEDDGRGRVVAIEIVIRIFKIL
jgi:hypothetical protein